MLKDILEEHIDNAEWLLTTMIGSADIAQDTSPDTRARLLANLDGLQLDTRSSWPLVGPSLSKGPAERALVAALLALDSGDQALLGELESARQAGRAPSQQALDTIRSVARSPLAAAWLDRARNATA